MFVVTYRSAGPYVHFRVDFRGHSVQNYPHNGGRLVELSGMG